MAKEAKESKDVKEEPVAPPVHILVRSALEVGRDGGSKVAVWEKDAAHPGGEAFVAGARPVEVALTPGIARAIANKVIEEVK